MPGMRWPLRERHWFAAVALVVVVAGLISSYHLRAAVVFIEPVPFAMFSGAGAAPPARDAVAKL